QEMITKGSAKLVANLIGQGALGARIDSSASEEMRYATEFQPPQLPTELPRENAIEVLKAWPHVGIVPSAFETRAVGQTLLIEVAREKEGALLEVSVVLEHVRFLRWSKTDAGRFANGERLSIDQPIFHTMKCQNS